MPEKLVAIAPFLRSCPQVVTLGVRASMGDYSPGQRRMLLSAGRVLFPTPRFVRILQAAGKKTFPSAFAYSVQKSRLIQEVLFQFLNCPHPLTRIYYGRQKSSILENFSFPLRAMGPRMQDGARLVSNSGDLRDVSRMCNPLIIQESLDYDERFRLVFVNYECAGVIRTVPGEMQNELDCRAVSRSSRENRGIAQECLDREIVSWLEKMLKSVQIDDIAVEIGVARHGWHLIELTRPPVSWPAPGGVTGRFRLISRLIESKKF